MAAIMDWTKKWVVTMERGEHWKMGDSGLGQRM